MICVLFFPVSFPAAKKHQTEGPATDLSPQHAEPQKIQCQKEMEGMKRVLQCEEDIMENEGVLSITLRIKYHEPHVTSSGEKEKKMLYMYLGNPPDPKKP